MKTFVALIGSTPHMPYWRDSLISIVHEEQKRKDILFYETKKPHENKVFPSVGIPDDHLIRAYELMLAKKCRITVWCHPSRWKDNDKIWDTFFQNLRERCSLLIIWIPEDMKNIVPEEEQLHKVPNLIPYQGPLSGVADLLGYFSS